MDLDLTQPKAHAPARSQQGKRSTDGRLLQGTAAMLAGSVILGQLLFLAFILAFYYPATLSGHFAGWNDKPLITGFQQGDGAGNIGFAVHVLFAAVITGAGMVQLLPAVRRKAPALHRWSGRAYAVSAGLLSLGGLALVWLRGTYLNIPGAIGISFNAATILTCLAYAWTCARRREFASHRRWALRLFAVSSAVWFMRVGYMAWGLATGGAGVGDAMDGPFDMFIAFGNTLLPLLMVEIYLRAERSPSNAARTVSACVLATAALVVLAGSAGAWMVMWGPYI